MNTLKPGLPKLQASQIEAEHRSRQEVQAELAAAKRSSDWMVNAELGNPVPMLRSRPEAEKSRAEVRAEVVKAYRNDNLIAENAEIGKQPRS